MDKTFRVLLIASIVIAISMGLSAFKKSKKNDVVVKEKQALVDKQSEAGLVAADAPVVDKGLNSSTDVNIDEKHNNALTGQAAHNESNNNDVNVEDKQDNSEHALDSDDKKGKKTDSAYNNTEYEKLAHNNESVVDDVNHNEVKDNSSSNDVNAPTFKNEDNSSDKQDKPNVSDMQDDLKSKSNKESLDAKSELVPIG